MEFADLIVSLLGDYLPFAVVIFCVIAALWLMNRVLRRQSTDNGAEAQVPRQLIMSGLGVLGIITVVLVLPMSDGTRGSVLSLLGVVLTGIIALSSTTFVANAMAGLMLRLLNSFRPGDFVRVGEHFGRVTERGLFHTEIQTEDRDLTTLPNLHLVTNPVTVVHSEGTMISMTVSLGYDVDHRRVEKLLREAATANELTDAYVHVMALGDYSVTYRVSGFLEEVKQLLTARSNLKREVLDTLHRDGVEIASPSIMLQRPLHQGSEIIPPERDHKQSVTAVEASPAAEEIVFDKAEEAAEIRTLREQLQGLEAELETLRTARREAPEDEQPALQVEVDRVKSEIEGLNAVLNQRTGAEG